MATGTKNKWLQEAKSANVIKTIFANLEEAWASNQSFGELVDSLSKEQKDVFLKLFINNIDKTDNGFSVDFSTI